MVFHRAFCILSAQTDQEERARVVGPSATTAKTQPGKQAQRTARTRAGARGRPTGQQTRQGSGRRPRTRAPDREELWAVSRTECILCRHKAGTKWAPIEELPGKQTSPFLLAVGFSLNFSRRLIANLLS